MIKIQRTVKIVTQSATYFAVWAMAICMTFTPQAKACGNPTNVPAALANRLILSPKIALETLRFTPSEDAAASGGNQGDNSPNLVGMWEFTMRTGTVLYDQGLQQFYADGNEMQNSSLFPPEVGNVCFGAWKHQSGRTFKLKHLGWLFDHGNFAGTLILTASITVQSQTGGDTYSGSFVADVILPSGRIDPTQHAEGTLQGKRFTVN
jgi:hypothetical protein